MDGHYEGAGVLDEGPKALASLRSSLLDVAPKPVADFAGHRGDALADVLEELGREVPLDFCELKDVALEGRAADLAQI